MAEARGSPRNTGYHMCVHEGKGSARSLVGIRDPNSAMPAKSCTDKSLVLWT